MKLSHEEREQNGIVFCTLMQISHVLLDFCINKWTHEADVPGKLLEQKVINVLLGVLSDCSFSPPASLVSLCLQSTSLGVVRLIQPPQDPQPCPWSALSHVMSLHYPTAGSSEIYLFI